jgi:uncharacterized protein YjbI with pentapeptide repeats
MGRKLSLRTLSIVGLGVLIAFGGLAWFLWCFVDPQSPSERNELVRTIAQTGGGLVLVGGLILTALNYQNSRDTLAHEKETQFSNRFAKAVEMLDDNQDSVRSAGVFAVESLIQQSDSLYGASINLLGDFVRRELPYCPHDISEDQAPFHSASRSVQTAIDILGRRRANPQPDVPILIDFTGLVMDGIDFRHGDFDDADFSSAWMRGADFRGASLLRANFYNVFAETSFDGANLGDASFFVAHLNEGTSFFNPFKLPEASDREAFEEIVEGLKNKRTAKKLAPFSDAKSCTGSLMDGTSFKGTRMDRASFNFCDLSKVQDLTLYRLIEASVVGDVKFPAEWEMDRERFMAAKTQYSEDGKLDKRDWPMA